jgi:hypothetical protein
MISPEFERRKRPGRAWTRDIDFESREFSDHFDVRSESKKFAYAFCNPRMMEFLLTRKTLSLEIGENHMLLLPHGWVEEGSSKKPVLADLDRVRSCLDTLAEQYSQILSHIPVYLLEAEEDYFVKATVEHSLGESADISPADWVRRLERK